MLYRVHRPHRNDGSYGTLLGYVNLCHGHINIHHIHESLLKAKIIPEHWFSPEELQAAGGGSHIYGVSAYAIIRRAPHNRMHLFYLYPVESQQEKQEVFNPWNAVGITFNQVTLYTTPITLQQSAPRTAAQEIRDQEDRLIDAFDANEY